MNTRLSRKTIVALGSALEMSAAIHVMSNAPAPAKTCDDAVRLLRRALRLPSSYSFSGESRKRDERERAQRKRRI